ncbi:MAG: hypothetical protein M3421_05280 [Bacteroidota bacterium]|jgi:hypothetical protein|nr:hypothetical protein [Bacteroidota bacterium]
MLSFKEEMETRSCATNAQSVVDSTLYLLIEDREDTHKIDMYSLPSKNKDYKPTYFYD